MGEPLWGWHERTGTCWYCMAKLVTQEEWEATEDGPPPEPEDDEPEDQTDE